MAESVEFLTAEIARLTAMAERARDSGSHALADLLEQDAARALVKLADLHTPVPPIDQARPVMQQQQQIQDDET